MFPSSLSDDNGAYNTFACNLQLLDTSRDAIFDTRNGYVLYVTGVISGPGGFRKQGTGAAVLSGANGYGGKTTVEQGYLYIDSPTALGSLSAGTTVLSAGELSVDPAASGGREPLSLVSSTGTTDKLSVPSPRVIPVWSFSPSPPKRLASTNFRQAVADAVNPAVQGQTCREFSGGCPNSTSAEQ